MRGLVGFVGLVVVLAVVAVLAKNQLSAVGKIKGPQAAGVAAGEGVTAAGPNAPVNGQSQQIGQQVQLSIDAAMQQARPMPEDK